MLYQKKIEVTATDNGWVLEWQSDEIRHSMQWPAQKTRGVEIYTEMKDLISRIQAFL